MTDIDYKKHKISVIIPCFREKEHVLDVISRIPDFVDQIICVDDCCPDKTGEHIISNCDDVRLSIITHDENQGVGGAMISGYQKALESGSDIMIKIDGDGQMDPELIPQFIDPIIEKSSDYTKGNRFFSIKNISKMPSLRLFGNAALSFMNKLSTGYWGLFDPNNGYTAINSKVLNYLDLNKINKGYFFESDMLFRLNILRAVVVDIPMNAKYGEETSHLNVFNALFIFSFFHVRNFLKRIFYNYFLRDFSVASFEWILGPTLITFSLLFGIYEWIESSRSGVSATAGTVMLAALPMIVGIQMVLSALSYDIENKPTIPFSKLIGD